MKQRLTLIIAMCCILAAAGAQSITGTVTDEKHAPIAYANVVLLNTADSTFLVGTVSQEDGSFSIDRQDDGKHLLRVSALGYDTQLLPLTGAGQYHISLAEKAYELKGVEVKARRPVVTMGAEGMKTDVKGSYLEKLGTANDILPFIPGLSGEKGKYTVFGRGTPVFYINGRLVRNNSELERLKSKDIENIELITSPGARYASNVSAVVKIKTRRRQSDGLGIESRTVYEQTCYGSARQYISWNYRQGKSDFFGEANYGYDKGRRKFNNTDELTSTRLWVNTLQGLQRDKQQSLNGVLGYNLQIDADHSLGVRYNWDMSPAAKIYGSLAQTTTADGAYIDRINSDFDAVYHLRPSHNVNLYYNGKWGKWTIDFNADYLYNRIASQTITHEYSAEADDRTVTSLAANRSRLYAAKLTLGHPLWGGNISLGAEYTYTDRRDRYNNPEGYLTRTDNATHEQIASPFVEYRLPSKIGTWTIGLRMEHSRTKRYQDGTIMDNGYETHNNLMPTLNYQHTVGKVGIMAGYSARTLYPTYHQMNQPLSYANRYSMDVGNPQLKNKTTHNVVIGAFWNIFQLAVSYDYLHNDILSWGAEMAGQEGVVVRSYINLPKWQQLAVQLSASPKWGVWHGQLSAGYSAQWLTIDTSTGRHKMNKPQFTCSANNAFGFKHGWNANLNARYGSTSDYSNFSYIHPTAILNANVQKSWAKDRFMVRFGVYDIFRQNYTKSRSYSYGYSSYLDDHYQTRSVVLTFRYRLNTTRNKYRGTGAGNSEKRRM